MAKLTYHDFAPDDFDAMMALASDWDIVRQLGRWAWPADPEQVRFYCKPFEGDGLNWTIKEDGQFAGRIGVTSGNLGYTLPKSAHGRGIATAAAKFAITQAFDLLDLAEVTGSTWIDNPKSARVLQKLGFTHWQTHYQYARARKMPTIVHQHRLSRHTWDRLRAADK